MDGNWILIDSVYLEKSKVGEETIINTVTIAGYLSEDLAKKNKKNRFKLICNPEDQITVSQFKNKTILKK